MQAKDFQAQGAAMYGGYGWMTRLAEALGVNVSTVHRYAHGLVPIPRRVELALTALRAERIREIEGPASVPAAPPPNEAGPRGPSSLPTDGPLVGS